VYYCKILKSEYTETTFIGLVVVLMSVSVAIAVLPLAAGGLIPATGSLVQAKETPPVALVAVYVVDTLLQRVPEVELERVYTGQ
jgi:hypothetical protein